MSYTFTQINANRYRFQAGNTVMDLDSSIPNGMGNLHGQIIAMVLADETKKDRMGQLLEWNSNFAFTAFCIENNLVIPPDEVIPEEVNP